jgi:hypothetical protein
MDIDRSHRTILYSVSYRRTERSGGLHKRSAVDWGSGKCQGGRPVSTLSTTRVIIAVRDACTCVRSASSRRRSGCATDHLSFNGRRTPSSAYRNGSPISSDTALTQLTVISLGIRIARMIPTSMMSIDSMSALAIMRKIQKSQEGRGVYRN